MRIAAPPDKTFWRIPMKNEPTVSRPVRIVVIGAGNRANKYLEYARRYPDRLQPVAVVDVNDLRRHAFARDFGLPACRSYAHYDDFFADGVEADMVLIRDFPPRAGVESDPAGQVLPRHRLPAVAHRRALPQPVVLRLAALVPCGECPRRCGAPLPRLRDRVRLSLFRTRPLLCPPRLGGELRCPRRQDPR